MEPLFFVHIPKTAGSSLHKSALELFGAEFVERNNGNDGPETTPLVREFYYESNKMDHYGFYEKFSASNKKWLTAHVFAEQLLAPFGAPNTISFVRDPVERVISNYQYMTKIGHNSLSFEEFYKHPDETNKQFRMIGQTVWQAYHMVGTLKRYSECLELLSASKALDFTEHKINTSVEEQKKTINDDTREEIRKWNERDDQFATEVERYLAKQLHCYNQGKPFCYHDMGFVPDTHIIGWAFYSDNHTPVDIGLYVDGKQKAAITACELVPALSTVKTPREGHNGFRFVLAPYKNAQHIEVKALQTDQSLFSWTRPS